jgi:hypothetical protein
LFFIRDRVNEAIQNTVQRVKFLISPESEEPHMKLLAIDMVNYFLGLLANEDRRTLISELFE